MDDLVRWLGEQLDVDAAVVERNSGDRGLANGFPDYRTYSDDDTAAADEYIEHFNPARVLREIDAKRQLVAAYAQVAANDVNEVEYAHGYANALGEAVRLLALSYSDRPGFKEEWRP